MGWIEKLMGLIERMSIAPCWIGFWIVGFITMIGICSGALIGVCTKDPISGLFLVTILGLVSSGISFGMVNDLRRGRL